MQEKKKTPLIERILFGVVENEIAFCPTHNTKFKSNFYIGRTFTPEGQLHPKNTVVPLSPNSLWPHAEQCHLQQVQHNWAGKGTEVSEGPIGWLGFLSWGRKHS
jgi:hypothetical protein